MGVGAEAGLVFLEVDLARVALPAFAWRDFTAAKSCSNDFTSLRSFLAACLAALRCSFAAR